MGLTSHPGGVSSFGMPVLGVGEETMTTGNVFFVGSSVSGASDGNLMTAPDKPGATIDAAIAKCTASNGDIIFVMPGHDENPVADIAMDVAGVWIRGLGWGADKPTITFGLLGAAVTMSTAGCRISNIRFDLGVVAATVTNAVAVTAADCIVETIETIPHATSQFTNIISVLAGGTRTIIRNCNLQTLITIGAGSGIYLDGCDDVQILNNIVMGHYSLVACIDNVTGADEAKQCVIANNWVHNDSVTAADLAIHMDDAATGLLINNRFSGSLALAANYNLGNMHSIQNYTVDGPDFFDLIIPTTTMS